MRYAMASPYVIQFTEVEQAKLLALLREYTSPYRDVVRAKVVLLESQGRGNPSITIHFDLLRQVVSKWRRRFHDERLATLDELPRSGRPVSFSHQDRCRDQACHRAGRGRGPVSLSRRPLPLARWSIGELRQEAAASGTG